MPPALFPSLLSPSSFRPCLMPSPWLRRFVPATSSPVTTAAPICPFSLCLALRPSQRPCYTQRPPRLSAHSSCVLFTQMGGKKTHESRICLKMLLLSALVSLPAAVCTVAGLLDCLPVYLSAINQQCLQYVFLYNTGVLRGDGVCVCGHLAQ